MNDEDEEKEDGDEEEDDDEEGEEGDSDDGEGAGLVSLPPASPCKEEVSSPPTTCCTRPRIIMMSMMVMVMVMVAVLKADYEQLLKSEQPSSTLKAHHQLQKDSSGSVRIRSQCMWLQIEKRGN